MSGFSCGTHISDRLQKREKIVKFIDKALAEKDNMSGADFLQAMADIYSEPQIWEQLKTDERRE